MEIIRWVVGPEHDEQVFARLGQALRSLGYELHSKDEGLAGSQEVKQWAVTGPGGLFTVEAETYVGLTVDGSLSTIEQLKGVYARAF